MMLFFEVSNDVSVVLFGQMQSLEMEIILGISTA